MFRFSVAGELGQVVKKVEAIDEAHGGVAPELIKRTKEQLLSWLASEHGANGVTVDVKLQDGVRGDGGKMLSQEFCARLEVRGTSWGDTKPHDVDPVPDPDKKSGVKYQT